MKTMQDKWILPVLICSVFLMSSCEELWDRCVEGNGERRIENRALQAFDRIEVNGEFEVQIDTGLASAAVIEADENLVDLVVTHISGRKLIIETKDGICIKPSRTIEITVSTPFLNEISLNGSGLAYCYALNTEELLLNLRGSGQIDCDQIETTVANIEVEGSGIVNANLVAENLTSRIEGSGEIKLQGACNSADYKIVGSGKIKASRMESEVCVAYISGSGIIDSRVNEALDATIIGSGTIYYTGNPELETYISGSGEVIER